MAAGLAGRLGRFRRGGADERFRKVFENGPLGMVTIDGDLRITDVNDAFCRIVGYAPKELHGRTILEITHTEDRAESVWAAQQLFSSEGPSLHRDMRCITKEGRPVWVSLTARAVFDDAGSPLYAIGIAKDIGDRKRMEAVMMRHNERLAADLDASLGELMQSRARILAAADQERRRIERDLHDGAQQRLVALRVRLGLASDLLDAEPGHGGDILSGLANEVDAALEEVRMLARGVYPSLLADRGLVEALRAAARRSPLSVTFHAAGIERHPEEVETAVYFACTEALQNAAKHAAGARSVVLTLNGDDGLRFDVVDDGPGFSVPDARSGEGLVNMRDRLEAVGGTLEVQSSPGGGTTVTGIVPIA